MKNCLIGIVDSVMPNAEKIKVWSKSFQKYSKDNIYLCTPNLSIEEINLLKKLNITYIQINFKKDKFFMYKRFKFLYYLLNNIKEELVLFTDVFDVVFQNNPFCKLNNKNIFLSGEGLKINQEPWNLNSINILFPNISKNFLNTEIICAGIIAGNKEKLKSLFLQIHNMSEKISDKFPMKDQAVLMYLNYFTKLNTNVFSLKNLWTINLTISKNPIYKKIHKININKSGFVTNKEGQIYDIVHQYTKINEWKQIINEKYI